jgi:hypothetical protein
LAKSKQKKRELSPEETAQAAAMKKRLEELAAQRKEHDAARARGGNAGGGWSPGGVEPHQIRSGRRGNR